jgi:alpha-D-xyloside xylohydrolase
MTQMQAAHETGIPPMRPLFIDFPADLTGYTVEDEYMFGPDLLVAPVLEANVTSRRLYLPGDTTWTDAWTDEEYSGGQWIEVEALLDRIPLFFRGNVKLPIREINSEG